MSYVTNVVLMTGLLDDARVSEINEWLYDHHHGEMRQVDEHAGGTKAMEVDVYLAAHNFLDEDSFIDFVLARKWRWPEEFLLVMQTEADPIRVFDQNTDRTQRDREAAES